MIRTIFILLCVTFCKINRAQDCGDYLLFKKNTTAEYSSKTEYGETKPTYTVTDIKPDSNGCRYSVSGKTPFGTMGSFDFEYDMLFENNVLKVSLNYLMNASTKSEKKKKKEQKDDRQQQFYLEYPVNMEVGQSFENIVTDLTVEFMKKSIDVRISIINREVVAKETVTTPAGKYECFKITYSYGVRGDGVNFMDQKIRATEWFAPGVGVVKTVFSAEATRTTPKMDMTTVLSKITSN